MIETCLFLYDMQPISGLVDAADPIVGTIPSVTLIQGSRGVLPCEYNRSAFAVYWKTGGELIVFLDIYYADGSRGGLGYTSGRFNITDDYSLVIKDVAVEDEGRYTCEVSDFLLGTVFRNYTHRCPSR